VRACVRACMCNIHLTHMDKTTSVKFIQTRHISFKYFMNFTFILLQFISTTIYKLIYKVETGLQSFKKSISSRKCNFGYAEKGFCFGIMSS